MFAYWFYRSKHVYIYKLHCKRKKSKLIQTVVLPISFLRFFYYPFVFHIFQSINIACNFWTNSLQWKKYTLKMITANFQNVDKTIRMQLFPESLSKSMHQKWITFIKSYICLIPWTNKTNHQNLFDGTRVIKVGLKAITLIGD